MADLVSLTCPSCNGKLQIGKDLERFACGYCGTEFVVNRGGGIVSLSPVVEGLKRVESGLDRTASELAIARLQKEISELDWLRRRRSSSREFWQMVFVIGGGFIAVVGMCGLFAGLNSGSFGAGLFFVLVGLGLILIGVRFLGESNDERELGKVLAEKQRELSHHKRIVKS